MTDDPGRAALIQAPAASEEQRRAEERRAREEADREARRTALVARHGRDAAILRASLQERDLHSAAVLVTVPGGRDQRPSLMGWRGGRAADMPPEVLREIGAAVRLPSTVHGSFEERAHWLQRAEILAVFGTAPEPPLWLTARLAILEHRLDTLPPQSRADVVARLRWALETMATDEGPDVDEAPRLARLRLDLDECAASGLLEMAPEPEEPLFVEVQPAGVQIGHPGRVDAAAAPTAPSAQPAQHGSDEGPSQAATPLPRTGAEKRSAILDLLRAEADAPGAEPLTDREIARRVGCSPQTVGNVRKALP